MESNRKSDLDGLADPKLFRHSVNTDGWASNTLFKFLEEMLTIRIVEEEIGELVRDNSARAPCHLGIGQEAIAVGVSYSLDRSDRVFGAHRSHSRYLALGGARYPLIAEVLGKQEGVSRGMGGSMHLYGGECGFQGSLPLVGATIPIAVGAALALKMDGSESVAVSYFGDGASEEGVFHESLNFAKNYGLPVLFVCENNLYSSHLDISLRQPSDRVARFADAHRISAQVLDGNDVVSVANVSRRLLAEVRAGAGPAFIEAVTYRLRGHVGASEDIDVGVRRRMQDVEMWRDRDPIKRLKMALIDKERLSEASYLELKETIRQGVLSDVNRAKEAGYPPETALFDLVYRKVGT